MDHLSAERRSRLMSRVRQRGTDLELSLRRAMRLADIRYSLSSRQKLPGTPDIIIPASKLAIFVDGCFWHGCPRHGTQPKTNRGFWAAKIRRNRQRDREVDAALKALGWSVLRFWQHDIKAHPDRCTRRIATRLAKLTVGRKSRGRNRR